jgi:branched-chain amino acid transport system substrate-binding protein
MKFRQITTAVTLVAAAITGSLVSTQAAAQAKEQFFPALVYRTGAYAPNGIPFANGFVDYLKLTNERGGINGVKVIYEECETAYATDRGVECYLCPQASPLR